jgi:hypothetical protein
MSHVTMCNHRQLSPIGHSNCTEMLWFQVFVQTLAVIVVSQSKAEPDNDNPIGQLHKTCIDQFSILEPAHKLDHVVWHNDIRIVYV